MISCSSEAPGVDPTFGSAASEGDGDDTAATTSISGTEGDAGETAGDTQGSASGETANAGTDAGGSDDAAEGTDSADTGGGAQEGQFWLLDPMYAPDMTPDGSTVVMGHPQDGSIFRWNDIDGAEVVASSGQYEVVAISADATRIAASIEDPDGKQVAAVWDDGIGWTELGDIGACDFIRSAAHDMSSDGSIVVGLSWEACSGVGFWWEDDAMAALPMLEQGNNRASAISRDGKVAAGFAQTVSRSPALWWDDGSSLVPDPTVLGEFHAISDDGTLAAGTSTQQAMYWTEQDGFVMLGNLGVIGNFDHTRFLGVCNGGQMLIGTEAAMFGSGTAIVWTPEDGLRAFSDLLEENEIEVPAEVTRIERAVSCSADGTRIAGTAIHAVKGPKAFVVDLPGPGPS